MRRMTIALILALTAIALPRQGLAAARTDTTQTQSVGLVLSGGGAKGIAHIGFIQALEENDIPIDCISGTSMGAIVGSLYAIGLSPAQMMDLIRSSDFKEWSSGQIPAASNFEFLTPEKSPQWLGVNVSLNDSSSVTNVLPTRLINPLPMSLAFMELYAPSTGACAGNFDRLMVPLRTVASDIYRHKSVVFSKGQLSEAVRASMSFPMVFQPIKVDGTLLYDGGLYDVYPVNVMMQDFKPDRLIGLNVSSPNTPPELNNLIGQLEDMIMNDPDYPFPDDKGINIRFHLDRFSLLDWGAADEIYSIGYKKGLEFADSIKERISARRPASQVAESRKAFNARKRPLEFISVDVCGAKPDKARYISYLFSSDGREASAAHPLNIENVKCGFYRVASTGRLRNLVPHAIYDESTGRYRLKMDADIDRDFKLGVGGYLSSTPGSMLYAVASYDPFALCKLGVKVEGWAGLNYLAAMATATTNLPTPHPSRLDLQIALTRENSFQTERMFYDFSSPAFLVNSEFYVKPKFEIATGQHSIFSVATGYGHITKRYHYANPTDPNENGRSYFVQDLAMLQALWRYRSLNDPQLPTAGADIKLSASASAGHRRLKPSDITVGNHNGIWSDFEASALGYIPVSSKFALGLSADAFYSTRKLLPSYTSSVVNAVAFAPLSSGAYLFDPDLRANNFVAAGVHPVLSLSSMMQIRSDAYLYAPMRSILPGNNSTAVYSKWFDRCEFLGELSLALRMPFGAIRAFADYRTSPAQHWTAGLSLGLLIRAPKFTN